MNKLTILIIGFLVVGGTLTYALNKKATYNPVKNSQKVCTMDAKMCPDGSAVGRTGPNCEFTECPNVKTTTPVKEVTASEKTAVLNTPTDIKLSETLDFSNDKNIIRVTLNKIDDSRCPAGAECIWAGELSGKFELYGAGRETISANMQKFELGTVNNKTATVGGLMITLNNATLDSFNITVQKNTIVGATNQ